MCERSGDAERFVGFGHQIRNIGMRPILKVSQEARLYLLESFRFAKPIIHSAGSR